MQIHRIRRCKNNKIISRSLSWNRYCSWTFVFVLQQSDRLFERFNWKLKKCNWILKKKQLQHKLFLMYSRAVVVAHNRFQGRLLMRLASGDSQRVQPKCSSKRLFYLLNDFRTPDDTSESAWTAWKKTPHSDTPKSKRRPALIWRLVKHLVHGGKQGQMYKRTNPSSALGAFLYF